MTENPYQSGCLNLPFVGHCTFGKAPACVDWNAIEADVAILGRPNDMGTQWRSGARFGPRGIREASTLFSFGHAGAYDHEDDSHGGFLYYEVLEMIQALVRRQAGNIVGLDLVEVAPAYDPSGATSTLAAQLLLNTIGFIFHARQEEKLRQDRKDTTSGVWTKSS